MSMKIKASFYNVMNDTFGVEPYTIYTAVPKNLAKIHIKNIIKALYLLVKNSK